MKYNTMPKLVVLLSLTALIIACGGGGNNTNPPAVAAEPALGHDIKTFVFTWSDVGDASYYQLFEDPDGISGFNQIGGNIAPGVQNYRHRVPLYRRTAASYLLKSCNSSGCVDSTIVNVANRLVEAVGYFKASNSEAQDQFGIAVALSADGSTLAIGSENEDSADTGNPADNNAPDSGAVYVYVRDSSGWQFQQYLKASSIALGNFFGASVSLSADGNTLAAAARGEDAVYLFARSNGSWSQTDRLTAGNPGADNFGISIDLSSDGSTLVVGADFEASLDGTPNNNDAPGTGAAYVFTNSGGWSQQAYLKAGNAEQNDFFGRAVAISGDGNTVAVGAVGEDSNDAADPDNNNGNATGAVYVFSRSGSNWPQQDYIKAGSIDNDDQFGNALDLSEDGNTLAVGVQFEDRAAAVGGAVYVFTRSGMLWSEQAWLKATMAEAGDQFGKAVSLSADGNRLLVGAIGEDGSDNGIGGNEADNLALEAGAAYVFERSAGSWMQSAYLKASNISSSDQDEFFGFAVSLSGDGNTVAVGAKDEDNAASGIVSGNISDDNASVASGAVYLY